MKLRETKTFHIDYDIEPLDGYDDEDIFSLLIDGQAHVAYHYDPPYSCGPFFVRLKDGTPIAKILDVRDKKPQVFWTT